MVITHSQLPKNNINLPLPFFGGNLSVVLQIIFINDCVFILTGSPGYYFFMILHVIQKIGDNDISPNSLNVMVNYHCHGENSIINR